jgi:hypothetical protein
LSGVWMWAERPNIDSMQKRGPLLTKVLKVCSWNIFNRRMRSSGVWQYRYLGAIVDDPLLLRICRCRWLVFQCRITEAILAAN